MVGSAAGRHHHLLHLRPHSAPTRSTTTSSSRRRNRQTRLPACLRPPPDLLRSASRWHVHLAVHRLPRWHESFGHCDCAEAKKISRQCSPRPWPPTRAVHCYRALYFFAPFCGLARRKARAGRLKNARRLCVVEEFAPPIWALWLLMFSPPSPTLLLLHRGGRTRERLLAQAALPPPQIHPCPFAIY